MAETAQRTQAVDLADFFPVSGGRGDRWRQPSAVGRARERPPGQEVTTETIAFMRKLDVKEIHGYRAAHGLKLRKPAALAGRKASRVAV